MSTAVHLYRPTTAERMQTLSDAFNEATEAIGGALAPAFRRITHFLRQVSWNTPAAVAGLEGRYMVRAGVDPAYRSELALNRLVQAIITGAEEDTLILYRENRIQVAVAAMRGWVTAYHPVERAAVAAEPTPLYDATVGA